ncbi:MAG: signal peptidase II [Curvibacter sp.]|jgi:signal peptidase II|nr:lipoprotein signal peptidase [Curvibacter sp.]
MGKSASGRGGLIQWLGIAFVILVLDQLSKAAILVYYHPGESTYLTEWLNLVRVHNTGAAFSFLAGAGGWQRWFFVSIGVAATAFMVYLIRSQPAQKLFCLALACVMGGAIGNVIDRLIHGYVVDMVDFHIGNWHFPAFNLADSAITLGVVLLLLDELLRVRRSRA